MAKRKQTAAAAACPVLPIALRIGILWDEHAKAEEYEAAKEKSEQSEEIPTHLAEMRAAAEETASFLRARSLAGALFQIALAQNVAQTLDELYESKASTESPDDWLAEKNYRKLDRLLDSVALALRDALGPEYEQVREVVSVYLNIDEGNEHRSLRWLEEIESKAAL